MKRSVNAIRLAGDRQVCALDGLGQQVVGETLFIVEFGVGMYRMTRGDQVTGSRINVGTRAGLEFGNLSFVESHGLQANYSCVAVTTSVKASGRTVTDTASARP